MTKIEAAMMEGKAVLVLDEERNRKDEQGSMDNGEGGLVTQKSIEIFINSQEWAKYNQMFQLLRQESHYYQDDIYFA